MAIEYRTCHEMEEFQQVTDLEIFVWGVGGRDAIAPTTLHVLSHAGGNVMGAFDGEQLIGCTIAFAMRESKRLWSHIAAVHPDYQGQQIGYTLKQKQREWAIAQGLERMSWTFDPAMRRNAHFNFHLLHVQSNTYHINFYGEMGDDINRGVPSDRMETMWFLNQKMEYHPPEQAAFLLQADDKQHPQVLQQATEQWHFVEIPFDFPATKQQDKVLALSWREAMRDALLPAYEQGYWAVDFVTKHDVQRCWYVLKRN